MRNIKINVQNILKDIRQRLLEKQIQIENYSIYSKLVVSLDEDNTNLRYSWTHTLFNKNNDIIENPDLLDTFLKNRSNTKNKNVEVIFPSMPDDLQEKFNQIL